jgi:hypothetical protein
MNAIPRPIRAGAMALILSAAMAAQQGGDSKTPAANPGFGPLVPNDVSVTQSGGQPHSNSTYQKDRNGNSGFDLGWIGLFGLAGLFGIGRKRSTRDEVATHNS